MTLKAHGYRVEKLSTPTFCQHCKIRHAVVYVSYRDSFRFQDELLGFRAGGSVCSHCLYILYSGEVNDLAQKALQSSYGTSQSDRSDDRWSRTNETVPA